MVTTFCQDKVLGYNIHRKVGNKGFMQDTVCCEMSPKDQGFELIDYNVGWMNTDYIDSLKGVDGFLTPIFVMW
ncbi:MAG: hypothetical protein R3B93_08355 [Bacteroidia bacterium]